VQLADLAQALREVQYALLPADLVDSLDDWQIVDCYAVCAKCQARLLSEAALERAVKKANSAVGFRKHLARLLSVHKCTRHEPPTVPTVQRRQAELRHSGRQATVTNYGTPEHIDYAAVAIHEGSRVIDCRFFDTCDFADPDIWTAAILGYVSGHGIREIKFISECLPPEYGPDGKRTFRIADKPPELLN
jgi:hypothetical protein